MLWPFQRLDDRIRIRKEAQEFDEWVEASKPQNVLKSDFQHLPFYFPFTHWYRLSRPIAIDTLLSLHPKWTLKTLRASALLHQILNVHQLHFFFLQYVIAFPLKGKHIPRFLFQQSSHRGNKFKVNHLPLLFK